MGFDYSYTCPNINKNISEFKSIITDNLSSMIDECCPLLIDKQKEDFIENYVDYIYNEFEYYFENVRKTNEEIRKEAYRQIENLEDENNDLKNDIDNLNDKITKLENDNDTISFENDNLIDEIIDLKNRIV